MSDATQYRKQRIKDALLKYEALFAEIKATGQNSTIRCDDCGSLVEVKSLTDAVIAINCQCGKWRDTLRGI